jgi:hypothetical protein
VYQANMNEVPLLTHDGENMTVLRESGTTSSNLGRLVIVGWDPKYHRRPNRQSRPTRIKDEGENQSPQDQDQDQDQ